MEKFCSKISKIVMSLLCVYVYFNINMIIFYLMEVSQKLFIN